MVPRGRSARQKDNLTMFKMQWNACCSLRMMSFNSYVDQLLWTIVGTLNPINLGCLDVPQEQPSVT